MTAASGVTLYSWQSVSRPSHSRQESRDDQVNLRYRHGRGGRGFLDSGFPRGPGRRSRGHGRLQAQVHPERADRGLRCARRGAGRRRRGYGRWCRRKGLRGTHARGADGALGPITGPMVPMALEGIPSGDGTLECTVCMFSGRRSGMAWMHDGIARRTIHDAGGYRLCFDLVGSSLL